MTEKVVPGPEPDWQPATGPPYHTGKNPASQVSQWEAAGGPFRMIAGLPGARKRSLSAPMDSENVRERSRDDHDRRTEAPHTDQGIASRPNDGGHDLTPHDHHR
ncbi:hypothetical protein [Kitasatospora sp. MBT63]|uniref:hypothetical protein n=1 Tax=Kitasatospora sp. MBT63 TaxID=1444768 RepID=UPI0019D6AE5D|nr:hypothetical protein [Kitasatospora sp. MBT63]